MAGKFTPAVQQAVSAATAAGLLTVSSTVGMYASEIGWLNNGGLLPSPVNAAFSTTAGGAGTLLHSHAYYYRVSALNAVGETLASAETSITTPVNGSVDNLNVVVNWGAVTGATSYNVYGRSTGAEQLIANVAAPTVTYTDDGTISPSGALPATNTTGATTSQKVKVLSIVSSTQLKCQKILDAEGLEANSAIPGQPSAGYGPKFLDNRLKAARYDASDLSAFNSGFTLYIDDQFVYATNLSQSF